jgi:hypothetical protein
MVCTRASTTHGLRLHGDTIRLGYQAALVSLHSPLYGRLGQRHRRRLLSLSASVALAHCHTGDKVRRAVFLHYGLEAVTHDWFT